MCKFWDKFTPAFTKAHRQFVDCYRAFFVYQKANQSSTVDSGYERNAVRLMEVAKTR